MKINRQDKKDAVTFADLLVGTVFEYKDEVYMKIPTVNECFNAINMGDITFGEFFGSEVPIILDAELVVK